MNVVVTPKVLVTGINPWIDDSGVNTLVNFFEQWDKNAIAHMYTRSSLPNTHICDQFFRISEQKVIRSIFNRKIKTGQQVENAPESAPEGTKEKQLYAKKHTDFMAFCRECVWLLGRWKTKELRAFLDDYAPDVLFFPVYSTVYMNRLQNYIQKYTKKPSVLYVSDDNYSYKSVKKTPLALLTRFWLRHHEKKLIRNASEIMVISQKQKEEYDRLFHTNCTVLTKGIDFSDSPYVKKTVGNPIKMVYTGKLIIGRGESLERIADALGQINCHGKRMELDIYTTDVLTEKQQAALNRNGCSVKGTLNFEGVLKVQKEADILVFVESLARKYRYTARLSFSTKITDYLKSGTCIFAVGDQNIAPMDYFARYDSAITATSYEEIGQKLQMLADNPEMITEYGRKAYQCGKRNHDKAVMHDKLRKTIERVARK